MNNNCSLIKTSRTHHRHWHLLSCLTNPHPPAAGQPSDIRVIPWYTYILSQPHPIEFSTHKLVITSSLPPLLSPIYSIHTYNSFRIYRQTVSTPLLARVCTKRYPTQRTISVLPTNGAAALYFRSVAVPRYREGEGFSSHSFLQRNGSSFFFSLGSLFIPFF